MTRNLSLWLHLVINALSTLLLSATNYAMQCLSSPTRKEVDKPHRHYIWLDIGVLSVRSLRRISRIYHVEGQFSSGFLEFLVFCCVCSTTGQSQRCLRKIILFSQPPLIFSPATISIGQPSYITQVLRTNHMLYVTLKTLLSGGKGSETRGMHQCIYGSFSVQPRRSTSNIFSRQCQGDGLPDSGLLQARDIGHAIWSDLLR